MKGRGKKRRENTNESYKDEEMNRKKEEYNDCEVGYGDNDDDDTENSDSDIRFEDIIMMMIYVM